MMIKRNACFCTIGLLLIVFSLSGCAKKGDDDTIVATVNTKPIYLRELRRELSNRVHQNPSLKPDKETLSEITDILIKRQLIIQVAMEQNMASEQKFVDTIKVFWEQTLIRDFVDKKNVEFDRYIFVTDNEVREYYDELKSLTTNVPPFEEANDRLKVVLERRKKTEALENWLEDRKKNSQIKIDKNAMSEALK